MSTDGRQKPTAVCRKPHEHGWMRRSDIGRDVWELPDGTLYRHHGQGELMVFTAPTLDWNYAHK